MTFIYEDNWRAQKILKKIIENPNIHHMALKRLIVDAGIMSTTAYEKGLKLLKNDNRVTITKDKNKLLYDIATIQHFSSPETDEIAKTGFDNIEKNFQAKWEAQFKQLKLKDKIMHAKTALHGLQGARNHLETLWLIKYGVPVKSDTHREIRLKIDDLCINIFKIISSDSQGYRIKLALETDTLYTLTDSKKEVITFLERWFKLMADSSIAKDASKAQAMNESYDKITEGTMEVKEWFFKVLSGEIEVNGKDISEYITDIEELNKNKELNEKKSDKD